MQSRRPQWPELIARKEEVKRMHTESQYNLTWTRCWMLKSRERNPIPGPTDGGYNARGDSYSCCTAYSETSTLRAGLSDFDSWQRQQNNLVPRLETSGAMPPLLRDFSACTEDISSLPLYCVRVEEWWVVSVNHFISHFKQFCYFFLCSSDRASL